MIKKTTKVIFKTGKDSKTEELVGGIPLSKGEKVTVHSGKKNEEKFVFVVADKIVDCFLGGEDQNVEITYILKKLNRYKKK